jgi:hypothetical protein
LITGQNLLADSKLVLWIYVPALRQGEIDQYLYPPVYLRKVGMLTLELPLLFLLMFFIMMSLNWNTGGFGRDSDIKHNVAVAELRAQAGIETGWGIGMWMQELRPELSTNH